MAHDGQITGSDDAEIDGTWLVELDADGKPTTDVTLIPLETLPIVPVWTIRLRWSDDAGTAFTDDEAVRIGLMRML